MLLSPPFRVRHTAQQSHKRLSRAPTSYTSVPPSTRRLLVAIKGKVRRLELGRGVVAQVKVANQRDKGRPLGDGQGVRVVRRVAVHAPREDAEVEVVLPPPRAVLEEVAQLRQLAR